VGGCQRGQGGLDGGDGLLLVRPGPCLCVHVAHACVNLYVYICVCMCVCERESTSIHCYYVKTNNPASKHQDQQACARVAMLL